MNTPLKRPARARQSFFQFTQQIEYGLFLLAILAVEEETGVIRSIRTIANDTGLSFSFLQKVANRLKKAGIIKAVRGKQGGFRIGRKAHAIFLGEVIEALEGQISVMSCLDENRTKAHPCPSKEFCAIKHNFGRVNHEIRTTYLSKPLSEFFS